LGDEMKSNCLEKVRLVFVDLDCHSTREHLPHTIEVEGQMHQTLAELFPLLIYGLRLFVVENNCF
jgi:hypothetical protein